MTALIIHGHFYQPPRENPWTGSIEAEPSATPFHDWNERIYSECYRPNAYVRLSDNLVVNNHEHISFNFGPTLLSWLAQKHKETYERIVNADHESAARRAGHGNAIAQAYGHAILPLCNERDLKTQIRWGLADFRFHFRRDPEALWLPETACNNSVVGALIDDGLRYLILAPSQAARVRPIGSSAWHLVGEQTIDNSLVYRCLHPDGSGRSIAVFFYDGPVSRAIAFENLLRSSHELVERFARAAKEKRMISIATDGETYGHHFKFGELGLAYALQAEASARGFTVTNYGEYLAENAPDFEVEIDEGPDGKGTSWSCIHGTARWATDCGCHTGGEPEWNQKWRGPLRRALDFLRDENVPHFESTRATLFNDPWDARDASIDLILDQNRSREAFLFAHCRRWLTSDERRRALTFLELQRMLLLMYTSCGWFFNDVSGIETIQILKYAGRAIDLMSQLGLPSVRDRFLEILSDAVSNRPQMGTGADIFLDEVEPLMPRQTEQTTPA